jgi:hypothetical protein
MMSGSSFSSGTTNIPHWTGSDGYGYEKYNSGYSGALSAFSGNIVVASQ